MKRLKYVMLLLLILLVLLLVVAFMLENQQVAIVSLFGVASFALPISAWLIAALLLGMIVGPLFVLVFGRRWKIESKKVLN